MSEAKAMAGDKTARVVIVITCEAKNKDGEWWGPSGFPGRLDPLIAGGRRALAAVLGIAESDVRSKTYYEWTGQEHRILVLPPGVEVLR